MRYSCKKCVKAITFYVTTSMCLTLLLYVWHGRAKNTLGPQLSHTTLNHQMTIKLAPTDLADDTHRDGSQFIQRVNPFIEKEVAADLKELLLSSRDYVFDVKNITNDSRILVEDIFISVKTTAKHHNDRIKLVLETWFAFSHNQTYIFSDEMDESLKIASGGRLINTNCSSSHARMSLCCKMSVEFDQYILSGKKWWCHVDDDTYLNIPTLLQLLQNYNHTQDWYLGRPSLNRPLEVKLSATERVQFWFATGGAGFCLSRPLALKMMPHAGGGRLQTTCKSIRLPDDCAIGYLVERVLHRKLTVIREFHSHLEALTKLKPPVFSKQISFSYAFVPKKNSWNVVNIANGFPTEEDPTRIRSLHCTLFPHLKQCPDAIFGQS